MLRIRNSAAVLPHHRIPRLQKRFLVFPCRIAVVDDAAADVEPDGVVLETRQRADCDVEGHRAIGGDPADGAAVGAARACLKFTDDLHGPNFRRACD